MADQESKARPAVDEPPPRMAASPGSGQASAEGANVSAANTAVDRSVGSVRAASEQACCSSQKNDPAPCAAISPWVTGR